jgi:RNA recognition motif-containing protein
MKKIFVGNLSWKTTEDQLKAHFEAFGKVVSAKIIIDQMTGKSKGFGFVEMENADDAANAIRELNDKPLIDRNLRVSLAQDRQPGAAPSSRGPRRDFGGSRDSYSSGSKPSRY